MQGVSWQRGTFAVVLFAVVTFLCYLEFPRYDAEYAKCEKRLLTHVKFVRNPVCEAGVNREEYERAGLLRCTDAEIVVQTESERWCAFHGWFNQSLVGGLARGVARHSGELWGRATGPVSLWLVTPLLVVFCYWVYAHERGETEREALRSEHFSALTDVMRDLKENPYAPPVAALPSVAAPADAEFNSQRKKRRHTQEHTLTPEDNW
jgi:hypothetical protein